MITLPLTPMASPLRIDDAGVVRIGSTRVTLDTLVGCYRDGNTTEEIVAQYPALKLAEVHAAIAYYLTHLTEVEAYLQQRVRHAEDVRRQVEAVCDQRDAKQRLLSRQPPKSSQP